MNEEDIMNTRLAIKESLRKLDEYTSYLRSRFSDVSSTRDGVKSSILLARKEVERKFEQIRQELDHALQTRQHAILSAIGELERKDLEPLNNLEEKINTELQETKKHIEKGNSALELEDAVLLNEEKNLQLQLSISPTRYQDIPCVSQTLSVSFSDSHTQSLLDAVHAIGEISMTGSLQITELLEQPGALLVHWDDDHETCSDSESFTDYSGVQEYMLQFCRTDNKGDTSCIFSTVYCGEETSFLVSDLEPHVSYTFRVCGRFGSEGKWGSWSIPRNGITTLDPHEWCVDDCFNQNKLAVYQLSNRQKTATKVFPDCSKVLRSQTMSYRLNTSLVFKIDETGDPSKGDGIGLTTSSFDFSNARQVLQCPGSVSINSRGVVYVNGTPMTTRLPQFRRSSVVMFETSHVSEDKLRVSITVDDKQVTFDWPVDGKGDGFYFAMGFQHSGWQVSV